MVIDFFNRFYQKRICANLALHNAVGGGRRRPDGGGQTGQVRRPLLGRVALYQREEWRGEGDAGVAASRWAFKII